MGYHRQIITHPPITIRLQKMNSDIEPEQSTIYALSSGVGKSGIAVVRISGPAAQNTVERLAGRLPKPRSATLRQIRNPADQTIIDQSLILWFPGPHSFTGEDIAEFHIHGGRAVINGLIKVLAHEPGLRAADPGEFTRRAFENGKLDLTETEGLADLIDAETDAQRNQALHQLGGGLSTIYETWRQNLIKAQSLIEAEIDFSDEEDILPEAISAATELVKTLKSEISNHLDSQKSGEIIRDGFRVVLAGPPNVGKSSILNALAKRDAAITSSIAGTTRDAIEVFLDLDGWPVHITDTAGIHNADDISEIERQGISRSLKHAKNANLVIWVMDISNPDTHAPPPDEFSRAGQALITIANKTDLAEQDKQLNMPRPNLGISAKSGSHIAGLINIIAEQAADQMTGHDAPVITRARHRENLAACNQAMARFLEYPDRELELRAEDLRQAASAIGRITGRIDVEDILDDLFSSFCIGK